MSNNPFENNPNFKQLFKISSNQTSCYLIERTELYQHITKKYYILFRYTIDNMTMPIRTMSKFTELLQVEVVQLSNVDVHLNLTTGYKDLNVVTDRIDICCGSLPYILQIEKALYDYLL